MRASISVSRNPSFTTSSHKASISPPSRPQSLKLPTISPNRVKYLSATCQHVPHHFSKSEAGISVECRTGDVVTIELSESRLINRTTGKENKLKPIGNAGPVSEAGGIFAYARKTGMIPSQNA